MADSLRTIDELDVDGRRVLLRADFNVPLHRLQPGGPVEVADDTRIRAALETIAELCARGARLVLVSHLGRPKGIDPALSMRPVADRLEELTGAPVTLAPAVTGPEVIELTERLASGEMLMLENIRYEAGETHNDPELGLGAGRARRRVRERRLRHRAPGPRKHRGHRPPAAECRRTADGARSAHAQRDRRAPGPAARRDPRRRQGQRQDRRRRAVSRARRCALHRRRDVLPVLRCPGSSRGRFALPGGRRRGRAARARRPPWDPPAGSSCRSTSSLAPDGQEQPACRALDGIEVPDGWSGLDIGPRTSARYAAEIAAAGTVFWNGPMGRFELEPFAVGTRAVAEAIASTRARTVVGGGETVEAMRSFGLEDRVTHLSTGGGATLELLEGRELPGVQALTERPP